MKMLGMALVQPLFGLHYNTGCSEGCVQRTQSTIGLAMFGCRHPVCLSGITSGLLTLMYLSRWDAIQMQTQNQGAAFSTRSVNKYDMRMKIANELQSLGSAAALKRGATERGTRALRDAARRDTMRCKENNHTMSQ